ncbi:single-stranded DNA-binding protein, mitochondrial [Hylaeus volcanicus]|uniref:single-stranded DNA-binding protein, mitochondrial n=1 Tax=Hylaeus volcanicus TaxID=313075 RepID=UPI0023B7AF10|nr:single-stranded DNA-binding protein, mitochondrial [Hylaeus volcanicus]
MFRRVLPKIIQSMSEVQNMRMCTNMKETKIEKTMNHITLLGRVGNDPQTRGSTDHPVVIFSVATHTNYKYLNGDFIQRTEWHRICVFKPQLRDTVSKYLRKGQRVLVTGKVSYGEFKDEEGQTKPSTAVIADDVVFFQT